MARSCPSGGVPFAHWFVGGVDADFRDGAEIAGRLDTGTQALVVPAPAWPAA